MADVAGRRLNLDHVGTKVGEQEGAVGPGEDLGQVNDAQAGKRTVHGTTYLASPERMVTDPSR